MTEKMKCVYAVVFVLFLSALQAAASPLARTEIGSQAILWEPLTEYKSVTLVVRGPDDTFYEGDF